MSSSITRTRTSRHVPLLAWLLAVLVVAWPVSTASAADAGAEQRLVQLLNRERAQRGLPGLAVSGELRDVARRHSARMAAEGRLYHNPNLSSEVGGWRKLGENVGTGSTADGIHTAFMGSAQHRGNLLSREFTEVGVGVERRDGDLWVTQVFRQPSGDRQPPPPPPPAPSEAPAAPASRAAPPAPPPPPPPPAPDPAPAPDPEPTVRLRLVFARVEAEDSGDQVADLFDQL